MAEVPPFHSNLPDARRAAGGVAGGEASAAALEPWLADALEDCLAEIFATTVPGLELQQLLLMFSPDVLGASAQLQWLRAHDRCASWWAAKQAVALVAYAGAVPQEQAFEVRGEQVRLEDVAREELALALRWTSNFAQTRIDEARTLIGALPQTMIALEAGAISPPHARVIAESAAKFAATVPRGTVAFANACAALERRVLPVAERQGLSRTRSAANRAVSSIDPNGRMSRRDVAYRGRGVWLRDDPDGVSTLIARMAAEHAHASYAAIEQLAMTDGDSTLGMGERRSLALLHLVLGGAAGGARDGAVGDAGAVAPAIRTHVDVVVDLPTLMGLQDNDGEIVGGGAIAAQSIRELVNADKTATMRRLVTDATTGHLLDIGRKRYVIPDALREFIQVRDQRCRFPGCDSRAATAEIDHAQPWDAGGSSDRGNLGALCKRHHQVKTLGGWQITASDASGACNWLAPSGHHYAHDAVAVDGRVADAAGVTAAASDSTADAGVPFADRDVREAGDLVDDDP